MLQATRYDALQSALESALSLCEMIESCFTQFFIGFKKFDETI